MFPTLQVSGVHVRWSTRRDGDFHREQSPDELERTRRAFVDLPWSQPDEIHGADVGRVARPGHLDGASLDAVVTDVPGAVLGIWVGDCAPVALVSESGRIGAVHAGWRGIDAGILQRTVDLMRSEPDEAVEAVLGPCIRPCCYEFGASDLRRLESHLGASVVGRTLDGRPALDVPAAVRAALAQVGVELGDHGDCTGCAADRYWSHRVRGERGRQVMAVWTTTGVGRR